MNTIIKTLALLSSLTGFAQQEVIRDTIKEKIPFEGMDMSWQNGSDRRTSPPVLTSKYFTGSIMVDANYAPKPSNQQQYCQLDC